MTIQSRIANLPPRIESNHLGVSDIEYRQHRVDIAVVARNYL
jgi:hypothetical protein